MDLKDIGKIESVEQKNKEIIIHESVNNIRYGLDETGDFLSIKGKKYYFSTKGRYYFTKKFKIPIEYLNKLPNITKIHTINLSLKQISKSYYFRIIDKEIIFITHKPIKEYFSLSELISYCVNSKIFSDIYNDLISINNDLSGLEVCLVDNVNKCLIDDDNRWYRGISIIKSNVYSKSLFIRPILVLNKNIYFYSHKRYTLNIYNNKEAIEQIILNIENGNFLGVLDKYLSKISISKVISIRNTKQVIKDLLPRKYNYSFSFSDIYTFFQYYKYNKKAHDNLYLILLSICGYLSKYNNSLDKKIKYQNILPTILERILPFSRPNDFICRN